MSLTLTSFQLLTSGIYPGEPITIRIQYTVENSYWHNFMPWKTRVEGQLSGHVSPYPIWALPHIGRWATVDTNMTFGGTMPTHNLSGQITVLGMGAFHVSIEELGSRNIVVNSIAGPPAEYPCSYCSLVFSTLAELDAHIRDVHEYEPPVPPPPQYDCPYCSMKFDTYAAMLQHVEDKHTYTPPPKPYNCTQCTMSFYTYQELIDHMSVYHPEKPPPSPPPSPPPNGENGDEVDWEKYLKWGLIGTGVIIGAVLLTPVITGTRKGK